MSSLAELDRSNVVDVDLGSAEFKANAHRHMAEWARRPPFYVLGSGPPQVVVGRYADVHRVFSDTETFASEMPRGPGWEQFNKIMDAQFVTQMDGEQHARVRRLLMPAFSSRRIEQLAGEHHRRSSTACSTRSRRTAPSSTPCRTSARISWSMPCSTAMVEMDERRKAIFVAFHDLIPGTTYVKPGESVVAGAAAAPSIAPWKRSRSSSRSGASARVRTSSAISSTPATPATSSTTASCSTRFSASAAPRCRRPAAPPAARSICSTPTTISASS